MALLHLSFLRSTVVIRATFLRILVMMINSAGRFTLVILLVLAIWSEGRLKGVESRPISRRRIGGRFVPAASKLSEFGSARLSAPVSMDNLTCHFYTQPLNHFDLPRNRSGTYRQRYCTSEHFVTNDTTAPIFFYTGNESPLEHYVEHTGLMWELAQKMKAQIVFAEHRYEGQSGPSNPDLPQCMAYSSSVQAIADYARLIRQVLWKQSPSSSPQSSDSYNTNSNPRPVICFGGSYGGMLSAWMRMRYPQFVAGAIAASAPIWGLPGTPQENALDAAYAVIRHGLEQTLPPKYANNDDDYDHHATTSSTTAGATTNANVKKADFPNCVSNLQVAYPLISFLGRTLRGQQFLTDTFRLCTKLDVNGGADDLVQWLQTPWFDLAEGSFPYPSNYIPFALTHKNISLPAWPLQTACWKSGLSEYHGFSITGSTDDVRYTISTFRNDNPQSPPSELMLQVNWGQVQSGQNDNTDDVDDWLAQPQVSTLLQSVRKAVSVWYNMTLDVQCYNVTEAAPNTHASNESPTESAVLEITTESERTLRGASSPVQLSSSNQEVCREYLQTGSWPALCCNEDMNLVITYARGRGNDMFWPPVAGDNTILPRSVQTYQDFVDYYDLTNNGNDFCQDPKGTLGFPRTPDPWSRFLDLQYANGRVLDGMTSNIVFSNGLLDPWSAAGVYIPDNHNTTSTAFQSRRIMPGLTLQTHENGLVALLLDHGGHHSDLMFSDPHDPPAFTKAREIEGEYIQKWIDEFWKNQGE